MGFYENMVAFNNGTGPSMPSFLFEPYELEKVLNAIHESPALRGGKIEDEFRQMYNFAMAKKSWHGKASRLRIE